ncbi:hypothetical protein RRG08_062385 [Elysia crispata]|uniref:SCP domain-containing protein n=1 Tax=Elysia crispata TaxID=231223 RepID=A0AAE1D368_9GAST|nr:hypothetical protein RRG08_062385 [Elysia crispata]
MQTCSNAAAFKGIFDKWVAEASPHSDGIYRCCGPAGTQCCHFTQVVWATTTKIGCGVSNCFGGAGYVACYYQPT